MRVHRFAVISGIGWLLDVVVLLTIVSLGVKPMIANFVSSGLAVTFVFLASQKTLFMESNHFLVGKFLAYLGWTIVSVTISSALIAALSPLFARWLSFIVAHVGFLVRMLNEHMIGTLGVGAAKVAVTPLTMYTNYVALSAIMEGRASWR